MGPASTATFAQYGRAFQEKFVQALLGDQRFAEQMQEVFDAGYLEPKYLVFLAEHFFDYAKKYKAFPTLQLLVTIIRDELRVGTDIAVRDQIVEYLQRIRSDPDIGDLPYVKDKSLDFCRRQALKRALEETVDQIQDGKYDTIVENIKRAVTVGTTPSLGHDFFSDAESRFSMVERNCVATGLSELDRKDVLNGGLGAGELGVIIGCAGAGKSHFLTFLGANAMRAGVNVLHYTLELSEQMIGRRYDSNLCDIDSNDVIENKGAILLRYQSMQLGGLMIKHFPTSTATINTLRAHHERLVLKGFKPGLILVDYADIMRSTRQYDSLRHELKLIYQELRGWADDLKLGIWTASQSNKEGANSDIVDLGNMAEAYGKAAECDAAFGLSRKSEEKAHGGGRLYIAKNRFGKDGIVYSMMINTARSTFELTGERGSFEDVQKENELQIKRDLRKRWDELQDVVVQPVQ